MHISTLAHHEHPKGHFERHGPDNLQLNRLLALFRFQITNIVFCLLTFLTQWLTKTSCELYNIVVSLFFIIYKSTFHSSHTSHKYKHIKSSENPAIRLSFFIIYIYIPTKINIILNRHPNHHKIQQGNHNLLHISTVILCTDERMVMFELSV